jgi:hypothetical protein
MPEVEVGRSQRMSRGGKREGCQSPGEESTGVHGDRDQSKAGEGWEARSHKLGNMTQE